MSEHSFKSKLISSFVIAALFLSACTYGVITQGENDPHTEDYSRPDSTQPREASPTKHEPEISSTAPPLSPQPPQYTPDPTPDPLYKPKYILKAELNYGDHHLMVEEVIIYHNNAQEALSELLLMVDPLYYPNVFHLITLTWDNRDAIHDYTLDEGQLRIPLREPLEPGDGIQLNLTYELNLPSPEASPYKRPIPFGYTSRQTNLVDWYPFVPPYVPGEGWLAHKASYYGEHLVYETADFEVSIRLTDNKDNLVIAASAPAKTHDEWHHFQHENARNFVWSVSHAYQVMTNRVGNVTIISYSFPVHSQAGEAVLKATSDALSLYSELFAPYSRDTFSVVEADFLDGMEYDGLYFLSNGFYNLYTNTPGEYLISIAAHETAHQWWYAMVGNDQAMEPWLDEAMCTYSERLFYENLYPEALDWWWDYRIFYYQPHGMIDDSIYNPHGEIEAYRAYRDAVYLNGALFLEDMRNFIGDEAFFSFLRAYPLNFRYGIVTTIDFLRAIKNFTPKDTNTIIEKYFSPETVEIVS